MAAAAVTRLDFVVRPEFGIAGRVTGAAGQVLAGLTVELFDAEEQRVKTAVTDPFGLYRIDGLPIGRYTLRLAPASLPEPGVEPPSRPLEIRLGFRERLVTAPDGREVFEQIPLTPEDLVYPQEGDHVQRRKRLVGIPTKIQ